MPVAALHWMVVPVPSWPSGPLKTPTLPVVPLSNVNLPMQWHYAERAFLTDWMTPGCVDLGDDGCVFAQLLNACVAFPSRTS